MESLSFYPEGSLPASFHSVLSQESGPLFMFFTVVSFHLNQIIIWAIDSKVIVNPILKTMKSFLANKSHKSTTSCIKNETNGLNNLLALSSF